MPTLISIVLPNYNYAQYLDERICSILDQTYENFELIILDDASSDGSREVIERYTSDPRVQTHYYANNSGSPFVRWNDGADMARGKYLWIAEADDRCHPMLLERLVAMLEAHPSAGMAYCQSQVIDGDGNTLHSCYEWYEKINPDRWNQDGVYPGQEQLRYLFYCNVVPNASAVLMRRDLYHQVGQADGRYRLVADWHLWAKMMIQADVAFVAETLNDFRTHHRSVRTAVTAKPNHHLDFYEVHTFILSKCSQKIPSEDIDAILTEWEERWFRTVFRKKKLGDLSQDFRLLKASFRMRPKIAWIYAHELAGTLWERVRRRMRLG